MSNNPINASDPTGLQEFEFLDSVAKQGKINLENVIQSAQKPAKGDGLLTEAGRSLQKKSANRGSSAFPNLSGNDAKNKAGQNILNEIIRDPNAVVRNKGGGITEVFDSNGRGFAVKGGVFNGFRELPESFDLSKQILKLTGRVSLGLTGGIVGLGVTVLDGILGAAEAGTGSDLQIPQGADFAFDLLKNNPHQRVRALASRHLQRNFPDFFTGIQIGAFGNVAQANGGFVIYPNKINNNMMQRVYSK